MAFWFKCPICRSRRAASESIIGRRVRCADCSNFVEVPEPELGDTVDKAELDALTHNVLDEGSVVSDQLTNVDLDTARSIQREPLPSELSVEAIPIEAVIAETVPVEAVPVEAIPVEAIPLGKASNHIGQPQPVGRVSASNWEDDEDDEEEEDEEPSFNKNDREETEMDMTPMVDVTFLLLIFFMVTASFTVQRSMMRPAEPTEDPSTNFVDKEEDNDETIEVQIDEFNTYTVVPPDDDPVECPSDQDFRLALRSAKEGGSAGISRLLIRAHGDCIHEKVVVAMDAGTEMDLKLQIQMVDDGF